MAEPVTIAAVADLSLLRVTADLEGRPELADRIAAAIGAPLPRPGEPSGTDPVLIWQGPSDVLIAGESADLGTLRAALDAMAEGQSMLVGDATAGLAVFDLSGDAIASRIVEWMHGCRAPRASTVRKLAGLRVTLLSETEPAPQIRAFVDRSYADYFRQWLEATLVA